MESADGLRIVVVEDDPCNLETIQLVLEGAGHTVRATERGSEALRWLHEAPCDLLITDFRMPEMDGPMLCQEIRARFPDGGPRTLFVSGSADLGPCHDDAYLRAIPVLFKPFTLAELFAAVERAVATVPT
jgi:CheY-like chemotaxis protein